MKRLLIVTALIELGTGMALICCPSAVVAILLASGLDAPAAVVLGRVAGAALFALGVACWMGRADGSALVAAMLLYNVAIVAILAHSALGLALAGIGLWPAVVLHAALAAWCAACFSVRPRGKELET